MNIIFLAFSSNTYCDLNDITSYLRHANRVDILIKEIEVITLMSSELKYQNRVKSRGILRACECICFYSSLFLKHK